MTEFSSRFGIKCHGRSVSTPRCTSDEPQPTSQSEYWRPKPPPTHTKPPLALSLSLFLNKPLHVFVVHLVFKQRCCWVQVEGVGVLFLVFLQLLCQRPLLSKEGSQNAGLAGGTSGEEFEGSGCCCSDYSNNITDQPVATLYVNTEMMRIMCDQK